MHYRFTLWTDDPFDADFDAVFRIAFDFDKQEAHIIAANDLGDVGGGNLLPGIEKRHFVYVERREEGDTFLVNEEAVRAFVERMAPQIEAVFGGYVEPETGDYEAGFSDNARRALELLKEKVRDFEWWKSFEDVA